MKSLRVRSDAHIGITSNPLDLAREFDRFECPTAGCSFYSRLIPASDYPSGEDTAPLHCPECGEYLYDSPYVFRGPSGRDGRLEANPELDALWSKVANHMRPLDIHPHFRATGVPRRDRGGVPLYDTLGIRDADFSVWVQRLKDKALKAYVPKWTQHQQFMHRRSTEALSRYTLKVIGWPG